MRAEDSRDRGAPSLNENVRFLLNQRRVGGVDAHVSLPE